MASKPRAPHQPAAPASRTGAGRAGKTKVAAGPASTGKPAATDVEVALAAFAHEVRTPLTGILAISDLLVTSNLGERERRWAETIKASAEHLAGLATLFVDAARLREHPAATRSDFFDLAALVRHAGDSLAGRAAAKGLRASVTTAGTLPAFVVGDPVRLRAALENLIDNAVKFTEAGRVGLKVSATRAVKGKVKIAFAVSDSGIGLTGTEIKRLFRPFSQASAAIAARFGGAGLGLSSVRRLARAMGGDVVAARRAGGTTFTMTVQLAPAPLAPPDTGHSPGTTAAPTRPLHLLGVEDNPFGRVVLSAILTELGHQVEFVGRGDEAIARAAAGGYDAVLMDLVLPGTSGLAAIRAIRALPPPHGRVPIIGVSGRGTDARKARAAGADAFLVKPVSPRALASALLEATPRAAAAP
jgi:CheY-like chemotaxis protein